MDSKCRLFVANISTQTTEEQLRAMLGRFGEVKDVNLAKGGAKGQEVRCAFVELADEQGAASAIAGLNGVEVCGRRLEVRLTF